MLALFPQTQDSLGVGYPLFLDLALKLRPPSLMQEVLLVVPRPLHPEICTRPADKQTSGVHK